MKRSQTRTAAQVGLATAAAMMLPGLATAQVIGPSNPMHSASPEATSIAAAADLVAQMKNMHAEMMAMQISGGMDHE